MRIISGLFKGKKILQPQNLKTRPLKDLTKESIFNIINHSNKFNVRIDKADILDVFAGVGSFGLECISRGARKVVFIENYKEALFILKKNIINFKLIENCKIVEKNAYENNIFKDLREQFDIIFLDPPYKDHKLDQVLKNIHDDKILNDDGIVILHRHKNTKENFPKQFKVIEEKKYGISKVFFLSSLN